MHTELATLSEHFPRQYSVAQLSTYRPVRSRTEQFLCDSRLSTLLLHVILLHQNGHHKKEPLSPRQEHAHDAYEYICSHTQQIAHVDDIARALALSSSYVRHVFQQTYGMSLGQCLTRMRLEHAKALLVHSSLPHKTIAQRCGFPDEQQFCRRFKAIEGYTPGNYRSTARQRL